MGGQGTSITWSDVQPLAPAVDVAASTLSIPGWSHLASDDNYPFTQTGTVPASFAQRFEVSVNTTTNQAIITDRYMIAGLGGGAYSLPNSTLENLANSGDLYFVVEQDACWCKHSFKVVPAGGGRWTLETADSVACLGACQKVDVPEIGSDLSYTQKFIPAGYTTSWLRGQSTGLTGGTARRTGKKCKYDSGAGCGYEFADSGAASPAYEYSQGGKYNLSKAERELTGYFTWPIRKSYMDIVVSRIGQIISGSCGCQADAVYKANQDEKYLAGCRPSFGDLQWTLFKTAGGGSEPGCMTVPGELPWYELTCSAANCDSGGPKVYWATITQLLQIINALSTQLQAYSAECPDTCSCPTPTLVCQSKSASKSKVGYTKEGDTNYYLHKRICGGDGSVVDHYKNIDTGVETTSPAGQSLSCCGGYEHNGVMYAQKTVSTSGSCTVTDSGGSTTYTSSSTIVSTISVDTEHGCHVTTVINGFSSNSGYVVVPIEFDDDGNITGTINVSHSCFAIEVNNVISGYYTDLSGDTYPLGEQGCAGPPPTCTTTPLPPGEPYQAPDYKDADGNTIPGEIIYPPDPGTSYSSPISAYEDVYDTPYTTETLISKTQAAMGDWDGTDCASGRDLTTGEGTYSESRGKYKVSIADVLPSGMPAGKRLKVKVQTVFTPASGSSSSSFVWVTLNPGEYESAETEIPVPTSNGSNSVFIVGSETYCEAAT